MRTIFALLLLTVLIQIDSNAEPDWLEEVIKKSYQISFSKDASAAILFYTAEATISSSYVTTIRVRKAVKILNSSGIMYGVLSEQVSPQRKIKGLDGWLFSSGNKEVGLSDKDVMEVSGRESAAYYDDSRVMIAQFQDVKSGDIIGFEYTVKEDDWTSTYQTFDFQKQQPVQFAQFSVELPDGWLLHKAEWHTEGIRFEQKENHYIWTANELPYQPEEPLMPSWVDVSRRVAISCFNPSNSKKIQFPNWKAVRDWSEEIVKTPSFPNESVSIQAKQLTEGLTTSNQKLEAIAAFVRDEIRYVAVEIGKERWQPRPSATTLHNRYGDCKDKTALMRAMLSAVDIPSFSALANTDYQVHPELPTAFQFNHCIIAIPITSLSSSTIWSNACVGGWLFFDPTDPTARLGDLSSNLQENFVLVANSSDTSLCYFPLKLPETNLRRYDINATLLSDGTVNADVTAKDFRAWAALSLYDFKAVSKEKEVESWQEYLSKVSPSVKIANYQWGAAGDSAWQTFQLTFPNYILSTAGFYLFKVDLIHASETVSLTKEQRTHPVLFRSAGIIETHIRWSLPGGWNIEGSPTPISSNCEAGSIMSETKIQGKNVIFNMVERYSGTMLSTTQYGVARKFDKDRSLARGQTLLLKKL